MFHTTSLAFSAFIVSFAVASSEPQRLTSLPMSVTFSTMKRKLPDIDRARAARIFELRDALALENSIENQTDLKKRTMSLSATNNAVSYVANVDIGSPATSYSLIIDTGSSNTWVGAGKKYVQTSSSMSTGHTVLANHGSANFSGIEYTDTVSLAPGLTIRNQSIGVATTSQGIQGADGVLGLGPVDLTQNTVSEVHLVPTVSDNLFAQGVISSEVLGVSFNPSSSPTSVNGELTFGGTDPSKYTGPVTYTPITSAKPASFYWGIDAAVSYGSESLLPTTAGIVDTGTTLLLLATDIYDEYKAATGATLDSNTGLLSITRAQYDRLRSLYFTVSGTRFELTPNAQILPRALNTYIGGTRDAIYLVVADLGMNSGSGVDFINGYTFLERFYSVFDTTNKRIGLAMTANTMAMTN